MNTACRGSIVVLVLFVMTICTVCALNLWRSTWYAAHLTTERVRHEQRFQAAQGLLNYGIAVARNNFETLCTRAKDSASITKIEVTDWQSGDGKLYKGVVELNAQHDHITIAASLGGECTLRCTCKGSTNNLIINDWQETV